MSPYTNESALRCRLPPSPSNKGCPMSYEGELIASYDAAHKRLLNGHPKVKIAPPLVQQPQVNNILQETILLRLEGIERALSELNSVIIRSESKRDDANAPNAQPLLLSVQTVMRIVCKQERVTLTQVLGIGRSKEIVMTRNIIFYLSKRWTRRSLNQIGMQMGGRDHSTVIRGIKKLQNVMEFIPQVNDKILWYNNHLKGLVDSTVDKPIEVLTSPTNHP